MTEPLIREDGDGSSVSGISSRKPLLWIIGLVMVVAVILAAAVGCSSPADVASTNLSKAADNFEIQRRIVFYNGITGEYILVVEGRCSIGNNSTPSELSITCKVGEGQYKKHFLGRSDNVTWFAEQIDAANVSKDHYKVFFRPQTIVPDVEIN